MVRKRLVAWSVCVVLILMSISTTAYAEGTDISVIMLVEPSLEFDWASDFSDSEGLARVQKDEKCGFIDKTGKFVVPLELDDAAFSFSEGLIGVTKDKKCGFIDNAGNVIVPLELEFDWVYDISEGLAVVSKDRKWGFIDKTGKVVVPLEFDWAKDFYEGLDSVEKDGKWGFIDKTGKFVVPPQFRHVGDFSEGLAMMAEDLYVCGFIDKTGKVVIPLEFDFGGNVPYFHEGLAAVQKGDKMGFIDKTSKIVIPLEFDRAWYFSEGLAAVAKDSKWGFIDKTGKVIVPLEFDWAFSFSEGLAEVGKDEKVGFIDKTGRIVVPLEFDRVRSFSEGLAWIRKDDKWGILQIAQSNASSTIVFSDVSENAWYYDYVSEANAARLFPDTGSEFHPNETVTIQEFFDMCYRAVRADVAWDDIVTVAQSDSRLLQSSTNEALSALMWKYGPDSFLSRQQAAEVVRQFVDGYEITTSYGNIYNASMDGDSIYMPGLMDKDNIDPLYAMSVLYARMYGYMHGGTNGYFRPKESLTKAEAVTIALRMYKDYTNNPVLANIGEFDSDENAFLRDILVELNEYTVDGRKYGKYVNKETGNFKYGSVRVYVDRESDRIITDKVLLTKLESLHYINNTANIESMVAAMAKYQKNAKKTYDDYKLSETLLSVSRELFEFSAKLYVEKNAAFGKYNAIADSILAYTKDKLKNALEIGAKGYVAFVTHMEINKALVEGDLAVEIGNMAIDDINKLYAENRNLTYSEDVYEIIKKIDNMCELNSYSYEKIYILLYDQLPENLVDKFLMVGERASKAAVEIGADLYLSLTKWGLYDDVSLDKASRDALLELIDGCDTIIDKVSKLNDWTEVYNKLVELECFDKEYPQCISKYYNGGYKVLYYGNNEYFIGADAVEKLADFIEIVNLASD